MTTPPELTEQRLAMFDKHPSTLGTHAEKRQVIAMARELVTLRERIVTLQREVFMAQRDTVLPNKDGKDVYDIGVKIGALLTGASNG